MKKGSFKQELQEDFKLCGRCFLERAYKRNHLCEIKRKGNYLGRIIFKE